MRCRLLLLIQVSLLIPADAFVAGPTTTQQKFQVRRLLVAATTEENDMTDPKSSRWALLDPAVKAKIIERGQERAIQNKAKRESPQEQKRRMMMFMKEKQAQHKRDARVARPLSFNDRTPLAALVPDMELTGIVISLTHFGAYVDVGSECDGLLHVSQFTTDDFVSHPRAVVTPGQEITVRVRSCCPERRKLQLTMLPLDVVQAQRENAVAQDRIELSQIETDDELWGELKRVTNYGAYVEVGAVVDGFLHFMDHPDWEDGALPTQFMKVGDRVRVWVADVDHERKRIKLTANRPKHVPGPIREWTRQ